MLVLCIDTSGAIYRPPPMWDFILVIFSSYFSCVVQNDSVQTANNCAHLLEHLCVALVLCIDTSGAIYRPPVCLHTTVKKAIIDCAASLANIQSRKHNMLHKYLTDPHNFRCPFVHLPRFVATQVLRWYLKVDLVSTMQLAVHFCEYCVI